MPVVLPCHFGRVSQVAVFGVSGAPAPSDNTDLFTFTVNGADVVDNDTVSLANGTTSVTVVATPQDPLASVSAITGDTGLATGDNVLSFTVTAADGVTTRDYGLTLHVEAAPVNTLAPVASNGSPCSVTTGTWTDSPDSYTYQWQGTDDPDVGWTNLDGQTSNTTSVLSANLRCAVTATNEGGSNTAYSNIISP